MATYIDTSPADPIMPFHLRFVFAIILLGTNLSTHAANEGIHADFHTSLGDFSVLLHPVEAPQAVANFIGLAEGGRSWIDPTTGAVVSGKPFYNGLIFHRVIRGFMNQGGCPLGDGSSGPGYSFRDEFSPALTHDRAKFYGHFFKDFYGFKILHTVSSEVLEWTRSVAMQASLPATLACVKSFSTTDFRPDLVSFKVPTLIIHGNDDQIVPIYAAGRAAAVASSAAARVVTPAAPRAASPRVRRPRGGGRGCAAPSAARR
jgi:cyclophilin family peptidyl-prolyl cis-trans isomerase